MAGGGSSVTITASRTSGVAPLGVFFEAEVTNPGVTYPFHELLYVWDFDETGTWGYGNGSVNSKGTAYGRVAAHVFSENFAAGTKTVTCTVYRRVGGVTSEIASDTVDITVSGLVAEWDQTNTVVMYSASGTEATTPFATGSVIKRATPGSITKAQLATDIGNGVRAWLFFGGESFTFEGGLSTNLSGASGPLLFGSFGAGKAHITSDNASALFFLGGGSNDIRWVNLELNSTAAELVRASDYCEQWTFLGCDFMDVGTQGAFHMPLSQFELNDDDVPNEIFIHGCTFSSTDYSGAFRMCGRKVSIQGNDIDCFTATGSYGHSYRMHFSERVVIQHNNMTGTNQTSTSANVIKFNGINQGDDPFPGLETDMTDIIISWNNFTHPHPNTINFATSETGGVEGFGDLLLEGNIFEVNPSATSSCTLMLASAGRVTMRNNIAWVPSSGYASAKVAAIWDGSFNDGGPDVCWFYNNTYVNLESPTVGVVMVGGDSVADNSKSHVANNLYYRDEGSGAPPVVSLGGGAAFGTDSNNAATATNPLATTPPTAEAHFLLGSGSAAKGAGDEVTGLFDDYFNTGLTQGSINQGAAQNQP